MGTRSWAPRRVVGRRWLLGAVALLAGVPSTAGCSEAEATPPAPASTMVVAGQRPASGVGGACQLLDFDMIESAIGTRFDVAAASQQQETRACVLQAEAASRPDLMLAVVKTSADASVFKSTVTPKGADPVSRLGKAAYRITVEGRQDGGPAVEVGWLSGDSRLLTLRYTFAGGASVDDVDALAPKLVELAKTIDAIKR